MKNNKFILLFTMFLIIYTGCKTRDYKYFYLKPNAYCIRANNWQPLPEEATVVLPNLRIMVDMPIKEYKVASWLPLINKAYATSPTEPRLAAIEIITDIEVITLFDYNKQYPSGTDISAICKFSNFNSTQLTSKLDFLQTYSDSHNTNLSNISNNADTDFWCSIPTTPDTANTKQRFAITLYTDKGARLSDTTQSVIILL